MRCIWPPDSVPMLRSSKPVRPTAAGAGSIAAGDAAEGAFAAPQPHRHHVVDVDRKRAVDLGRLRQVGDVAGGKPTALDTAGEWLERADDRLEQRRLAGAVRSDDGGQRALLHHAVKVMHGRVPVVAEGKIVESERAPCGRSHRVAHSTATQINAIKAPASARRLGAESRSSDGESAGDGWAAPAWWWCVIM